ncbi:bifunctional alpha/beta hydrolase/OsmC family protein [Parvibaculum sp.]|uniref:bifunctional alpha/beta hydrolase/OsmC family protein n=1 Tax=Parvibaculum sp. TaxID=2024848 RepID=UPI000C915332|nr:bifunctional alpha/beta hydrolase/OsmC family protein [Parvibaculum sp.]MAB15474.1 osmotically inducible protein C [Parvibaculum sp.]
MTDTATQTQKVTFKGALGEELAARLDSPKGPVRAYALFAHCFTCSKDVFAASRVSKALAARGIAVLRFDFTGLGASDGDFANTNFTSNVQDLIAAADFLREEYEAPALLIGHSLGGAAVLAAARRVPEARAVATISAPYSAEHVKAHLRDSLDEIESAGEAEVLLAGRSFRIRKQFLDDIEGRTLAGEIAHMNKALIVFHAPLDEIVSIDNATEIFAAAKHPKSFVSLDDADHLLSRRKDAVYVADVLSAWASRFIDDKGHEGAMEPLEDGVVRVEETRAGKLQQRIAMRDHVLTADEPEDLGGMDSGPTPYDLLLAALGACTSMTLRMYADRKKWPLERVRVDLTHKRVHAEDCADCETETGMIEVLTRDITVTGDLDEAQREKLLEIADKCPVHRTITHEMHIPTKIVG